LGFESKRNEDSTNPKKLLNPKEMKTAQIPKNCWL
jgi:hypothetical protein